MLGPLLPPMATLFEWYCSDRMYWLPWPRHVDGWWRWAEGRENVLFVHYEEMKRDFAAARDRVARFLGYVLTPDEQRHIDARCSFQYMHDHEEWFDMAPPTMSHAMSRWPRVPHTVRPSGLNSTEPSTPSSRMPPAASSIGDTTSASPTM